MILLHIGHQYVKISVNEVNFMETKRASVMILNAGGTAGVNSKKYRVAIPNSWIDTLNISDDNREIEMVLDGDKIILQKVNENNIDTFKNNAIENGNILKEYCYYNGDTLCSKIIANFTEKRVCVENSTDILIHTAFGVNTSPSWEDFLSFLEERCVPRTRKNIDRILNEIDLSEYDPIKMVEITKGKMAEDNQWLDIKEM